jgi:PAS domain S-box-containing protein
MGEAAQTGTPETQLFRDVFNTSPIGIAVEDLDGKPLFVNPAFCSFLGFTEEELRNKHCVDFSLPEDAEKDWQLFQQLKGGLIDQYQLEKRYFRRDGSLVWGRLSLSLLNTRPSPLVLAMVEDITEKKAAEEARFQQAAIIESSDDAIASGTLDGIIVSWNAGAQRLYGYTEAEAVGKPITMLVPPELPDEENKILETLRAGGRIEHFETVRVTKSGKKINVALTISPIKDSSGKTVGISGIARDITERKRADEALRASEERLRLAQSAARIGTFEWNIQTGIDTWTPELEAMHGLPPGGFSGTQTAWENLVHPDDRVEVLLLVKEALKTGRPMQGEWRVVWPDRSVHWIAGHWQVLMNESGKPLRMVGVNVDITEHKLAEQELSKANERLRLALEAGSAGGWDYDLKTGKDVWFGTAHAQLGMTPDETSESRKEFWDRVHEDDRERVEQALQVAKEKREEYAEDVRVVWRDGTTHWLRSRGRFQYAANGEAERSLGISLDITERKMAEERLREYERAVEGSEEMIAVVDREYRYLIANNQFLKMRNMTREQVVGRFAHEVLNKGFFETVVKPKLDECFQGKVVRYETKYSYPELGERDIFISYFPIEAGSSIDRVACIVHDITDRKRTEEALLEMNRTLEAQGSLLRSREELLRVFVKNVPAAVAMLDRDMRYLQVSDRWCTDYLPGRAQILGRSHYEIFPDMPERWKEVHRRALQGETLRADEDRWDGQGGPHWARWEVRPWKTPEGAVGGILIFAEDITRRKQMEEALSGMSRKLIESQEQERARMGRELHDDIGQRLALLALELDQLQQNPSGVQSRLGGLRKETIEIANDVQALSHELHSSNLEILGVVASMRSRCREFGERQNMEINFISNMPNPIPRDVSLCLLRVLQEALHNAVKHSGVKRVEVQLAEHSNEVHLTVRDLGRGFDIKAARQGSGLGLTSMEERVRLVNGTIVIDSKPMGGATVLVRVPLEQKKLSERAVG